MSWRRAAAALIETAIIKLGCPNDPDAWLLLQSHLIGQVYSSQENWCIHQTLKACVDWCRSETRMRFIRSTFELNFTRNVVKNLSDMFCQLGIRLLTLFARGIMVSIVVKYVRKAVVRPWSTQTGCNVIWDLQFGACCNTETVSAPWLVYDVFTKREKQD